MLGRYGLVRTVRGDRQGFLRILRQIVRRLKGYTIWLYVDGARWHRGAEIDTFLRRYPQVRLDYLPPYQPALNPQERIWRRLRYEGTTNRWFNNLAEVWMAIRRTTHAWSPQKIRRLCRII